MFVTIPLTVVAALAALAVALVAWRLSALSALGAVAAAVLGTLAVRAGWTWGVVLVGYFVASSALSRYRAADKEARTGDRLEKGGRRDAAQVLANGGVFGLAALASLTLGNHSAAWQAAGAGALAASAADTWATEIGVLARRAPRSIVTFRPVAVGTSGGVTGPGFAGGAAGAIFVGVLAWLAGWPGATPVVAAIGGLAGSLLDSLLGATVQCRRWCHTCHADTERVVHACGTRTTITGGWPWLNNDGVNALATLGGAGISAFLLVAAH